MNECDINARLPWGKKEDKKVRPPKKRKNLIFAVISFIILCMVIFLVNLLPHDNAPISKTEVKINKKPVPAIVVNTTSLTQNVNTATVTSSNSNSHSEQWKPPKGAYKDPSGIWRHPGGMRVYDPTRPKTKTSLRMAGDKQSVFRYRSEKEIERLLTIEPGQQMFGTRRYDERFEEDFLESLKDRIVIADDDSDEDKNIKQMMIETKAEISGRIKAGESLKDILEQTRNDLQHMAEYKRSLQKTLNEQIKPEMSDQELDDLITAANKMLERNGISPIKNKGILKRNLRLNSKGKNK